MSEDAMPADVEMIDENEFDVDLGGIDTSIPLLEKDDKMLLKIKKIERKKKKDGNGHNLVVYLTNAEAAVTTTGVTVVPGEGLITKYFALQANPEKLGQEDYDPDRWKKDLAAFVDAVFGTNKDNRPNLAAALAEMTGALIIGKVKVEEDKTGEYQPKNVVSGFKYNG